MTDDTAAVSPFNQTLYWAKWMLATAGGWFIGFTANVIVVNLLGATSLGEALNATNPDQVPQSTVFLLMGVFLVLSLIVGLAVGALQWLVLRQQIPQISRWALFTGLGFALGTFISPYFMGLGVGLAQWLVLRRDLNKTGWWPVMSAVAWPLGYMFGGVLGAVVGQSINVPFVGALLGNIVSGALIGAITGAVLMWMLRENRSLLDGMREEAEQAK
jgi:hypothetical protein